ncbi:MAG: efflux RND transporter periplasmic adaptor subunit [Acidobacteria bacterium]|nr:efflux RND transporter periplasmic adaptor subunit [Acidobacteriota bacterium]
MRKRPVILTVIGIAVIAATVVGFRLNNRSGDGQVVEVEPVARRTVVQTVNATGKIQPVTQVNISADVSAKITSLSVVEGDWVEKGQLLIELDRERYVAAVESTEANLRVAEANVVLARENMVKAQKDHERTAQLFEKSLESQATLDTTYAGAQVEKARFGASRDQVAQAQATLKEARDVLSKTAIYAPISGTVSRLNKEVGEIALGSQFQEDVIMELSNLAGMEALVDVDENDIVLVALNDNSEIEIDALQGVRLAGEVTEIASSAKISAQGTTDQKTEFEVKIGITDPEPSLRPGMTASADIVTDVHDDALCVKIQCVAVRTLEQLGATQENDDESRFEPDEEGFVQIVWIFSDGVTEARQITTGIQGADYIEVLSGLDEGEQVVVGSYRAISRDLTDGAAVRVNSEEPTKG